LDEGKHKNRVAHFMKKVCFRKDYLHALPKSSLMDTMIRGEGRKVGWEGRYKENNHQSKEMMTVRRKR